MEEEDGEVEKLEEGGDVEGVVGGFGDHIGCRCGCIGVVVAAENVVVAAEKPCEDCDSQGPTDKYSSLVEGRVDRVKFAVGCEWCLFEGEKEGRGDRQVDGVLGDVD